MTFEPYTSALRESCLALFDSNGLPFFAPEERPGFESWLDKLASCGESAAGSAHYFLAQIGGRDVACGGFYVDGQEREARMAWGMVHRQHHRKGIGTAFLKYRIDLVRQLYPSCTLALDTTQHSVGFYEKQGFVTTRVITDHYAPGLHRYDMILAHSLAGA